MLLSYFLCAQAMHGLHFCIFIPPNCLPCAACPNQVFFKAPLSLYICTTFLLVFEVHTRELNTCQSQWFPSRIVHSLNKALMPQTQPLGSLHTHSFVLSNQQGMHFGDSGPVDQGAYNKYYKPSVSRASVIIKALGESCNGDHQSSIQSLVGS